MVQPMLGSLSVESLSLFPTSHSATAIMTRALITGASGFVGSNLAQCLRARGWDVRGMVRSTLRNEQLAALGVEVVQGTLHDAACVAAAVRDVDFVFHVAGRTAALRANQFVYDNVDGTRAVAQACAAQQRMPTMVFVSSLAAGGPGTFERPRSESDVEQPVSAYGRSKLSAEAAAAKVLGGGALSIVRPPMVFGQGDRASLQLFRSLKLFSLHAVPGRGHFPLSLVHVTDLCEAIRRVAESGERVPASDGVAAPTGAGRYYVAADRAVTYGDLGRLAARAGGWRVVVVRAPRPMFWFAGALGEATARIRRLPTIFNFDKVRETMAPGWVCSDEKIRRDVGYQQGAMLEDRFAETVAWYREQKWL